MDKDIIDMTFDDRDEYKRKSIAQKIVKLVISDIDTSPMIIDGGWGTGKTEFCHKLINLFKKEVDDFKVVYVNAFNEDHTDSPITTVLAAIATAIPEKIRPSLIKSALPVVRFGLKTTLNAGASWLIRKNADEFAEELKEAIKKSSRAAIDGAVNALLEDHIDSKKHIDTLKIKLKDIAKTTPIVVCIDELDRCKPSFAISIIENIKHVFDVDNLHFILISNTQQLRASIHHTYGNSVDANRYLDKFIRYSLTLPEYFKEHSEKDTRASSRHWENICSTKLNLINENAIKSISNIINMRDISLREVETFARHIEIYQTLSLKPIDKNTTLGRQLLYLIGVFIFCFDGESAKKITSKIFTEDTIINSLRLSRIPYNINRYPPHIFIILYAIQHDYHKRKDTSFTLNDSKVVEWNGYVDSIFHNGNDRPEDVCELVIKTIETLEMK